MKIGEIRKKQETGILGTVPKARASGFGDSVTLPSPYLPSCLVVLLLRDPPPRCYPRVLPCLVFVPTPLGTVPKARASGEGREGLGREARRGTKAWGGGGVWAKKHEEART